MLESSKITQRVKSRDRKILIALGSFVFGIFLASLIPIPPLVSILIFLVAVAIYWADKQVYLLIALVALAFGILRFDIKDFHEKVYPSNHGIIVNEPEVRNSTVSFVVKSDNGERLLVSTDEFSEVEYGDEVNLIGKISEPKGSYAEFLSKDDIYFTMSFAKVSVLSSNNGNFIIHSLLGIKKALISKIRSTLPEPESNLLAGLLVAGKHALPEEILSDFRRAGVVHIVVLSGYNLTVIAEFFLLALAFLGKRRAAIFSIFSIALFTLMTGGEATVLRGAIMVSLLILGRVYGREGNAGRILLFAASLMLLFNPKALVFDLSFQLSFLAMLGLLYGAPIAMRLLTKVPERFNLRAILAATLATQVAVFPHLLYNLGNFSTTFLFSNLLILPIIPVTMLLGFTASLIGFVSTALAWPIALLAHLLLKWILLIAHFFGSLDFSLIQMDNFPLWLTVLIYLALIGVLKWISRSANFKVEMGSSGAAAIPK